MGAILVAFDSKNGSTAEVARSIAARLRQDGVEAEVVAARSVRNLEEWKGVVVGAPIYSGHWLSGGHRVLKRLSKLPDARRPPVAVFALGPRQDAGPESWVRPREQLARALAKHRSISPVATALFGGVDPPKKRTRRDIRDWKTIEAWADELADHFGGSGG